MTIGDLGKDYVYVEPTEVYAGSTWRWKKEFSDYPANNWALNYYFRETKGHYSFNITATADGKTHKIDYAKTNLRKASYHNLILLRQIFSNFV